MGDGGGFGAVLTGKEIEAILFVTGSSAPATTEDKGECVETPGISPAAPEGLTPQRRQLA
jgi:hypothetical protein